MFDLGELRTLSSRDLLKISHVFVTHSHMDHFIGFDALLRVFLGREKELHIVGPSDFFSRIEGRLAGYTWNLVNDYPNDFNLRVSEVHNDRILTRLYPCRNRFRPKGEEEKKPFSGTLLSEPSFQIKASILDHRVPCLGLSLEENFYVNIIKEELKKLDLAVGPWINRFKNAIYKETDPGEEFIVTWEEKGKVVREKAFLLGELAKKIARISPGQKIAYVTDVIGSPENRKKIIDLAKRADYLYIEAAFMDQDKETAKEKYHLTAKEAGELAREAQVKNLILFHFSPRYTHMAKEIQKEAMDAFMGN